MTIQSECQDNVMEMTGGMAAAAKFPEQACRLLSAVAFDAEGIPSTL
jgi:hypothetical protein